MKTAITPKLWWAPHRLTKHGIYYTVDRPIWGREYILGGSLHRDLELDDSPRCIQVEISTKKMCKDSARFHVQPDGLFVTWGRSLPTRMYPAFEKYIKEHFDLTNRRKAFYYRVWILEGKA